MGVDISGLNAAEVCGSAKTRMAVRKEMGRRAPVPWLVFSSAVSRRWLSGDGATPGRRYAVFDAAQAYPFLLITLSRREKSNPSEDEDTNDSCAYDVSDLSAGSEAGPF